MRRVIHLLILLLVVSVAPVTASADELPKLSPEERNLLTKQIQEAKDLYNEGDFQGALTKFRDAHSAYPHPDLLYRIALCHERLGQDQDAIRYYREFLAAVPEAPERPRIEKTIQMIEKRISQSEISVTTNPTGATVYINDVTNGAAGYTPTALKLKPGTYTVIVERNGFTPVEELVELSPGQQVQLRYQLKPIGGTDDPTVKKRDPTATNPYLVPTVLLTTLAVTAGIVTFVSLNKYSDASADVDVYDKNPGSVSRAVYDDAVSARTRWLVVTLSAGGLATVAAIMSYVYWNKSAHWTRQQRVQLSPLIGPDGVGFGLNGTF